MRRTSRVPGDAIYRRRGFTLIELVIVIAIIGILASLSIPKFIDLSVQAKIAKTKAGVGILRSLLATRYAASATGGATASYPTWIVATDFAIGEFQGRGNEINNHNAVAALTASVSGLTTSVDSGFWFVSLSSSSDYGKVGAYSDGTIDTSVF